MMKKAKRNEKRTLKLASKADQLIAKTFKNISPSIRRGIAQHLVVMIFAQGVTGWNEADQIMNEMWNECEGIWGPRK